jgi:hypothetical protein
MSFFSQHQAQKNTPKSTMSGMPQMQEGLSQEDAMQLAIQEVDRG